MARRAQAGVDPPGWPRGLARRRATVKRDRTGRSRARRARSPRPLNSSMALSDLLKLRLVALLRRNKNFAIFSGGNAVSLIGMWMERIAVGWLAWQLTE